MASTLLIANNYLCHSGDNTIFRRLGTAISNAFANSGWVQANDAGQINWTTVVANGTFTSWAGSEIWRMNDAWANVAPIYVKIDYGTAGGTNNPQLQWTLGSGSNGALGLTGVISANTGARMSAVSTTVPVPCYFCGNPDRIILTLMCGGNTTGQTLGIERTRDANGNTTPEGALIFQCGGSSQGGYTQQYWNCKTGPAVVESSIGVFISSATWSGLGPQFNWYPIYPSNGVFTKPLFNYICASNYHVTPQIPFSVTHYGATHTYMPIGGVAPTNRSGQAAGNFPIAMLWE